MGYKCIIINCSSGKDIVNQMLKDWYAGIENTIVTQLCNNGVGQWMEMIMNSDKVIWGKIGLIMRIKYYIFDFGIICLIIGFIIYNISKLQNIEVS